MNFRTVDEFENFDFNEAHIGGIEVKSGHVFLYLDNVMISAKNSCNRDIREMRTNDLVLKLQDGQITSFVKEGVKVYNADGVFQREIPDEIIPLEKYQETFDMLLDKYHFSGEFKRFDNLDRVLEIIRSTGIPFVLDIKNGKVIIREEA